MKRAMFCSMLTVVLAVAAAAQVTLPNGVTVPKNKMIVFLFAGHSNMAGRVGSGDQNPDDHVWAYGASGHDYWEPCKDRIFNNSSGAGPATPFLKKLKAKYPDYYFGVIQNANTQAGVRWHNGDSNNRYWKGAGRYNELINFAKKLQPNVTIGGLVAMLGLMERNASEANTFADDFVTMVKDMRNDLGLSASQFPVFAQDYEQEACGSFDASSDGARKISQQLSLVPGKLNGNAVIVPTDGIPCPDQCHHFDQSGMNTWTQRAIDLGDQKGYWHWAGPPDTEPPTAPSNLSVTAKDLSQITLSWTASSDEGGIAEYIVYWNSESKKVSGSTTQATITGLEPCTDYSFTAKATDFSGNTSAASSPLATKTECSDDATAPTAPTGLKVSSKTSTTITLSWSASTDNTGVTGYEIFQGSTEVGETTGATSYTVTGLAASTSYTFTVKARDAAGNRSAASNSVTGTTADRTVAQLPLKVNVGGNATSGYAADKAWEGDGDFGYTGTGSSTASSSNAVSGTDDDAVFQSVRYKTFGYKIAVPDGYYAITLLFAEFWRSSEGGREFRAKVEGSEVPGSPVDIYKAVGQNTAHSLTYTTTISDGYIDIAFEAMTSDPMLNGVVVQNADEVAPYTILSPNDGDTFVVGQTLTISYEADVSVVQDANFDISVDNGKVWHNLNDKSVSSSDTDWGTYEVTVPSSINGVSLAGKEAMLRIRDYDEVFVVQMEGTVRIEAGTTDATLPGGSATARHTSVQVKGSRLRIGVAAGEIMTLRVLRLDGSTVYSQQVQGPAPRGVDLRSLGTGLFLLRAKTETSRMTRRVMVR